MLNCWCITWPVGFKRLNPVTKLCPNAASETKANNHNFPSTEKNILGIYDRSLPVEKNVVKARRSSETIIIRVRRRTTHVALSDYSHRIMPPHDSNRSRGETGRKAHQQLQTYKVFNLIYSIPLINSGPPTHATDLSSVCLPLHTEICPVTIYLVIRYPLHHYAPAAFTPRNILVLIFRGWVYPRAHGNVRTNSMRHRLESIPGLNDL